MIVPLRSVALIAFAISPAFLALPLTATAQVPPSDAAQPAQGDFEAPPVLDAARILQPDFAAGPGFTVRGPVPAYAGLNQYTVDSDFGVFFADGNTALVALVAELRAMGRLAEVSRTEVFVESLKTAAASPIHLAENLVQQPVTTVSGVPKGVWKMLNRAGQTVKEAGQGRKRGDGEGSTAEEMIGFSKTKRELALSLGVDPYSTNDALQKQLNGIAWAAYAGKVSVSVALAPVGGAVSMTYSAVNVSESSLQSLRDMSPSDLRRDALKKLTDAGIPRDRATSFLNCAAYTPTLQRAFVDSVLALGQARGRGGFVLMAASAEEPTEALFYARTAQLMAAIHAASPVVSVREFLGFPCVVTAAGEAVIPLEWDYAVWTQRAASAAGAFAREKFEGDSVQTRRLAITGAASDRLKAELAKLGIALTEFGLPGPLKPAS